MHIYTFESMSVRSAFILSLKQYGVCETDKTTFAANTRMIFFFSNISYFTIVSGLQASVYSTTPASVSCAVVFDIMICSGRLAAHTLMGDSLMGYQRITHACFLSVTIDSSGLRPYSLSISNRIV